MRLRMLAVCLLAATAPLFTAAQNIENAKVTTTDASRGAGAAIASLSRSGAAWFAWKVPIEGQSLCCWTGNSSSGRCGRCFLDGHDGMTINRDEPGEPRTAGEMLLLVRVEEGRVRRVRYFDAGCTLDGQGNTIHLLSGVTPESSIDYFRSQIANADNEGNLVAAISLHAHAKVVPLLIDLARHDANHQVRRHAIFWLGQKAGDKAAGELRRAVDEDPDDDVRKHAVFAISQLPRERAVPMLIDLVKNHKSREVRKRAIFWLAETEDPRALQLIEEILGK